MKEKLDHMIKEQPATNKKNYLDRFAPLVVHADLGTSY